MTTNLPANLSAATKQPFGKMPDGTDVDIFTLTNSKGAAARITNYGGALVSLEMPDKNGEFDDVVLGYETLDEYINGNFFMGALIGRYCNRIAEGKFSLNGTDHALAQNRGGNHLHGGNAGFHRRVWNAAAGSDNASLELTYFSPDGEENYPGNLQVKVTYTLTEDDELRIDYFAVTDKDTPVNLTNHSYFNLGGGGSDDILGHILYINGDKFLPVDDTLIPTGELRGVKGTPMDFTAPAAIGGRIDQPDAQLELADGYDQNWVLNKTGRELSLAARVSETASGRVMEVYTTKPGMQFYSGNRLQDMRGKNGRVYQKRAALCLETQYFPDSPNKPHFPSSVLRSGEEYAHTTIYKFSVVKAYG
jgi:aldose 1-epimerase